MACSELPNSLLCRCVHCIAATYLTLTLSVSHWQVSTVTATGVSECRRQLNTLKHETQLISSDGCHRPSSGCDTVTLSHAATDSCHHPSSGCDTVTLSHAATDSCHHPSSGCDTVTLSHAANQSMLCVAANIEKGSYDERDVERVRADDEYLTCFIRSFYQDSNMDVVLTKLDTVLTFRKTIGLNGKLVELYGRLCQDLRFELSVLLCCLKVYMCCARMSKRSIIFEVHYIQTRQRMVNQLYTVLHVCTCVRNV